MGIVVRDSFLKTKTKLSWKCSGKESPSSSTVLNKKHVVDACVSSNYTKSCIVRLLQNERQRKRVELESIHEIIGSFYGS